MISSTSSKGHQSFDASIQGKREKYKHTQHRQLSLDNGATLFSGQSEQITVSGVNHQKITQIRSGPPTFRKGTTSVFGNLHGFQNAKSPKPIGSHLYRC